jgi:hypothetical protein
MSLNNHVAFFGFTFLMAGFLIFAPAPQLYTLVIDNDTGEHMIGENMTFDHCAAFAKRIADAGIDEAVCIPQK